MLISARTKIENQPTARPSSPETSDPFYSSLREGSNLREVDFYHSSRADKVLEFATCSAAASSPSGAGGASGARGAGGAGGPGGPGDNTPVQKPGHAVSCCGFNPLRQIAQVFGLGVSGLGTVVQGLGILVAAAVAVVPFLVSSAITLGVSFIMTRDWQAAQFVGAELGVKVAKFFAIPGSVIVALGSALKGLGSKLA